MTDQLRRVTRALLSVSDKSGLIEFARALAGHGIELVSTGGTAKAIADAGLKVRDVSDLTGFPEMMDGRVKTLHPKVHGGLLAIRGNAEHDKSAKAHGIAPIDLLVVNLYPFEATVDKGASEDDCIENIDIGGPAMIRAAAKNHNDVAVVVEADDYAALLAELAANNGSTTLALRRKLAAKAYARTAAYDAAISNWFADQLRDRSAGFPRIRRQARRGLALWRKPAPDRRVLPHAADSVRASQPRARCRASNCPTTTSTTPTPPTNASASSTPRALPPASSSSMPTRAALPRATIWSTAYRKALACDPTSAFGGIIAMNRPLDAATARAITEIFTEVIIAPDATDEAIAIIGAKKNLRLLLAGGLPDPSAPGLTFKTVAGGMLVQTRDNAVVDEMNSEDGDPARAEPRRNCAT